VTALTSDDVMNSFPELAETWFVMQWKSLKFVRVFCEMLPSWGEIWGNDISQNIFNFWHEILVENTGKTDRVAIIQNTRKIDTVTRIKNTG